MVMMKHHIDSNHLPDSQIIVQSAEAGLDQRGLIEDGEYQEKEKEVSAPGAENSNNLIDDGENKEQEKEQSVPCTRC